jgi:hypothetical protein
MNGYVSTSVKVASGFLVSVLVGCGGSSGGGYMASAPAPAPAPAAAAPTASFSQPTAGASINFGQTVNLAWTSSNATSCTASTSGAAAGAFTGSESMTGTLTVVPTAAGSYTYTLNCTGTGGTTSAMASVTVSPNLLATLTPTGAIITVGSTIDPLNGDQNPYGLVIAPATAGLITKGDLIVCNFNNGNTGSSPNTQGLGTTIIGLHPVAGSTPYRIAQSAHLQGCNALAMLPDDSISAAAWSTVQNPLGENPLVGASGVVATPFSGDAFAGPWGEAYVPATSTQPAAIYVSNAPGGSTTSGGSIDRITLNGDAPLSFTEIATGFCSGGSPGSIFGPAGLTYDATSDTLYIVNTSAASVVAFAGVSSIGADGVVVNGQCTASATSTPVPTFSGPSMASARVIAHGAPFNTPLSAALLKNGDLIVGNADIGVTAPSATTNLLIEVSPAVPGGFVGQPLQIDTGAPGALFGIAATIDASGNQIIYFNDDNAPAVMQLGPVAASSGGTAPYAAAPR